MVKRLTSSGILIALAMIFSYIESLIPFNFGIPGIKLGLANLVVVVAFYLFKPGQALAISLLRILLVTFTFGSLAVGIYSLAGGILSFAGMYLLHKVKGFSVIGVSVAGGVLHNIGQLIVAIFAVSNLKLAFYLPILLIAGVVTGALIGLAASLILSRLKTALSF